MKVVTTCHKAGFEQYGQAWLDSTANWPDAEFVMYAEGFAPKEAPRVVHLKQCEDIQRLVLFKEAQKGYVPPSWEHDIVRFSNKVYAAWDAFKDYPGLCVWLDADCVTYRKIPEGYIEAILPQGCFMGLYQRAGIHTETGFWVMDGSHPEKQAFFDTWLQWFETGEFKRLHQWHDCTTLDATVKLFERDGRIKVHNLSGEFFRDGHPIVKSDLGKYLDHRKGARKSLQFSPENPHT